MLFVHNESEQDWNYTAFLFLEVAVKSVRTLYSLHLNILCIYI